MSNLSRHLLLNNMCFWFDIIFYVAFCQAGKERGGMGYLQPMRQFAAQHKHRGREEIGVVLSKCIYINFRIALVS